MEIRKFAITTGDSDGIGLEVVAKALSQIRPTSRNRFFVFRSKHSNSSYLKLLDQSWQRIPLQTIEDIKSASEFRRNVLYDICSDQPPPIWVEQAATLCTQGVFSGMTTAPLSKTLIKSVGLNDLGHTDILKRVSRSKHVFMTFLGKQFSVLLLTDHIPLHQVSLRITSDLLKSGVDHAMKLLPFIKKAGHKKICLVGLNPHAGEDGLLGAEELSWTKLLLAPPHVEGPFPPDTAFLKKNWKKYSFFISPYHDQGLIPFKLVHGFTGVHLSLGLPFVRTSVDHGTAKDIFNLNKADCSSMKDAISCLVDLATPKYREVFRA